MAKILRAENRMPSIHDLHEEFRIAKMLSRSGEGVGLGRRRWDNKVPTPYCENVPMNTFLVGLVLVGC